MNTFEHLDAKQLISRVGETDQEFLTAPSPELANTRALLRLALANLSRQKAERTYFLTEAAALLELALMDNEDLAHALQLSSSLSEIYLSFYQLTHEQRYLTICNQILKPLAHHEDANILLRLVRTNAAANHPALTKHWLGKLLKLQDADIAQIRHSSELSVFKGTDWLEELLKQKLH